MGYENYHFPVPEMPCLSVKMDGTVWSRRVDSDQWRELETRIRKNRQAVRVSMSDGSQKQFAVDYLVTLAMDGPPPTPKHKPIHADGDLMNCQADNLSWGLRQNKPRDDNGLDVEMRNDLEGLGKDGIRTALAYYWQYGATKVAIANDLEIEFRTIQWIVDTYPRHDPNKVYHDELPQVVS